MRVIYEDRSGALWIGTRKRPEYYSRRAKSASYTVSDGLAGEQCLGDH